MVKIKGTPESNTAVGKTPPVADLPIEMGCVVPFTYTVIAWTSTFQNSIPVLSATSVEYRILLGSVISSDGCLPMPKRDGTWSEPGLDKESERKGETGAKSDGVMEKRLDAQAAPSASFVVTGGREVAMMEFSGRASPKIPLKLVVRGSFSTSVTAATEVALLCSDSLRHN